MRAHLIENGTVINTIEVESLDFMPGLIAATEGSIGWLYDGKALTPPPAPPVPVPQIITIRQARLALLAAGLLDDVNTAVAAASKSVQIEWEYVTELRRDWPTLIALAGSLGLTGVQVDELFIAASKM